MDASDIQEEDPSEIQEEDPLEIQMDSSEIQNLGGFI
jgi:hypothetical protein